MNVFVQLGQDMAKLWAKYYGMYLQGVEVLGGVGGEGGVEFERHGGSLPVCVASALRAAARGLRDACAWRKASRLSKEARVARGPGGHGTRSNRRWPSSRRAWAWA